MKSLPLKIIKNLHKNISMDIYLSILADIF